MRRNPSSGAVANPVGEAGFFRVVRGGTWNNYSSDCRAALRWRFAPMEADFLEPVRTDYLGFRPARTLP